MLYVLFIADLCCIIGIAVYAAKDDSHGRANALAYSMTTFFTSGACGLIAAVFLILTITGQG